MKGIVLCLLALVLALPVGASAFDVCARPGSTRPYVVGGGRKLDDCRPGDQKYWSPPPVERTLRYCMIEVQANWPAYQICRCNEDEVLEMATTYRVYPTDLDPQVDTTIHSADLPDLDPMVLGHWFVLVKVFAPKMGDVWLVLRCASGG